MALQHDARGCAAFVNVNVNVNGKKSRVFGTLSPPCFD